ncbi:MAG: hypothetical protein C0605_02075 [Hyphomicrobiales bacterium]|nr:MAG: hypothetical protein C0605_02075 [Hyphomicrobiales bacterium]
MEAWSELLPLAAALLGAGLIAGVIAGVFGVGGGAVLVPVFYQLFAYLGVDESVRMHLCVGTSLGIIVPTSIRSFRGHLARGAVDMDMLRSIALPVLAGVGLGSVLAAFVPAGGLKGVFALVALLIGLKMLLGRAEWRLGDDLPRQPVLGLIGVAIGTLSTLMGIGGGVFGNSLMTLYNRPIHQAVATSSGLGVLISIPGVLGFIAAGWGADGLPPLSLGYVSLIGVALVIPTSVLAAPIGVRIAHAISRRRLEIAFALFLFVVSARFFIAML